jgi:hypothetical protein
VTAKSLSVLFILSALRPVAAENAPSGRLQLTAEPPVVGVSGTAPGRQFVELPTLEYRFEVQAACGGERTPRSLSINVADTRLALSGAALEEAPQEVVLTIPARQLAPIAVDDFCVAGGTGEERIPDGATQNALAIAPAAALPQSRRLLTVPAVMSAQASLVCAGEDGHDIRYVTEPLGVTLSCTPPVERAPEPGQPTPGDR